ncbi:hypothetical protein [Paraconexibacter sp. AEG42_29]|uniref:hypothetical protein n=1 Tax=Paraconexibacter sp. AEG42_29 TaxID=2997339 RepID=UPI00339D8138
MALLDESLDRYLMALPSPTDDPMADIRLVATTHVAITMEAPDLGGLFVRELRSLSSENARRIERRSGVYLGAWVSFLRRAYPDTPASELEAAASTAMTTAAALILLPHPRVNTDHEALVADMIVASLSALERAR